MPCRFPSMSSDCLNKWNRPSTRRIPSSRQRCVTPAVVGLAAAGQPWAWWCFAILLGGVITPLVPLGVAGSAVMMAGALLTFLGLRRGSATEETAEAGTSPQTAPPAGGGKKSRAPKPSGGFMDRLDDRWQKRRDDGPGGQS